MGEYEGTPIDGMPQAARYFFNKDLSEVTPAEAATLIGMIQAPTLYDPRRHPDSCRKRRDVVLGVMKHAGVIDDADLRRRGRDADSNHQAAGAAARAVFHRLRDRVREAKFPASTVISKDSRFTRRSTPNFRPTPSTR